jgi:hypothetical protein
MRTQSSPSAGTATWTPLPAACAAMAATAGALGPSRRRPSLQGALDHRPRKEGEGAALPSASAVGKGMARGTTEVAADRPLC